MNKFNKLFVYISLFTIGLCNFPFVALADNASLYLTPASLSQQVGSNFTIYVGVNSGGNAINAIEATVNIPTSILSISDASSGGSICSIWVQQPTISGSTVSFKCGIPGGTTASGNLIGISLNARVVGSGNASISAARVLAGPGTNATGGTSGGNYTVTPASSISSGGGTTQSYSTSAPSVSSGTHPDQNAWYKNNNPSFSWNKAGGTTGFSYVFDQNAGTIPAATINTTGTSVSFQNKADGIWYFHIRAYSTKGWSNTSIFRVQIDNTVPSSIDIVTEPKVTADRRPMVSFNAVDATSGIDHYDLKLDEGDFQTVKSPYTPPSINSGDHVFTVRAYDMAGNYIEGTTKIKIKDIPIPNISTPADGSIFKLAQQLTIKGTANPTTSVDLYFDGVSIARSLKVDDQGNWSYQYQSFIMPGKHKIFAIGVKDGIESKMSKEIGIRIDPSAVNILGVLVPSYLVFIVLLVVIFILTVLVGWLFFFTKRKYDQIKAKMKERNKTTKAAVDKQFESMEKKLREEVQDTYEKENGKNPKVEHQLEGKIDSDIVSAEKEVDVTIDKEIKGL